MSLSPHRVCLLSAANSLPLEVIIGFIELTITSGDITRRIDALVIPSLEPDCILLDNYVMSRVGAVLDYKNQRLGLSSSPTATPAIHKSTGIRSRLTPPTSSPSVVAQPCIRMLIFTT